MFGGGSTKKVVEIILRARDETGPAFTKAKGGVGDFLKSNKALVAGFVAVGTAAVKMGRQLYQAFRQGVAGATEFQKAVSEISTLTDQDEAGISQMSSDLQDLAAEFGQLDTVMAKAQYNIVSAGFSDITDSMHLLRVANKAAIAGISDVNTTAKLITQTLNAYGLEASEAERISGILFTTIKGGVTTMPELAAHLGQVTSTAATAGISFAEVAAAMAAMTKKGIDTAQAATALNGLIIAIGASSGESKALLDDLGISLSNGLAPALAAVDQAGGASLETLKLMVPNVRALKAAASVGADGAKEMRAQLAEMENGVENFNTAYSKMVKDVAQQQAIAEATARKLSVALGERGLAGELEYLKAKTAAMDDTAETLDEYGEHIEDLAKAWGGVKGAVVEVTHTLLQGMLVFGNMLSIDKEMEEHERRLAAEMRAKAEAAKEGNATILALVGGMEAYTETLAKAETAEQKYNRQAEESAKKREEQRKAIAELSAANDLASLEGVALEYDIDLVKVNIAPDGSISYVGKTPAELAAEIQQEYQAELDKADLEAPDLTIFKKEGLEESIALMGDYGDAVRAAQEAERELVDTLIDVPVDAWPDKETLEAMQEYEEHAQLIDDINSTMQANFQRLAGDSVKAFLSGGNSAKNFAKIMQTVVIDAISAVIAKLLVLQGIKLFSGPLGFLFNKGGTVPGLATGGTIPGMAGGGRMGTVPFAGGARGFDSQLIAAEPGEHYFDRTLSRRMERFLLANESASSISPFGMSDGGGRGELHLHMDVARPVGRLDAISLGEDMIAAAEIIQEADL